ncbi:MAG: PAS domain S-box protein [Acidobacteriia bacterium]|nr:PAS domain S-box protein [Terriglobia bacterium]
MLTISEQKRIGGLLRSQEYLASVLESATDAIVTIDSKQNVVLFNAAAEKMFRCSAEQALGKPIEQFLPEAIHKQHREWVRGFGDGTVALRRMGRLGEVAGLRAGGGEFMAEASISKCMVDGEYFFTAILRDITERKKAGEEQRATAEQYRSIYKSFPIPTYSWQWQQGDLVLVSYNDAAMEVKGAGIAGLMGRKAREVFAGHPEAAEDLRQCYEEKRVIRKQFEHKYVTTGRIATLDVTLVFVPPDMVLAHSYDITERKNNELALRKLSSVAEQTADPIIITDREGMVEYVNPAFENLSGYSSVEMLGKNPSVLKSGKMPQAFYEELWKTILDGKTFRGLFVNRKKNGELYYVEKAISPLKNEKGEITHFVSSGRDRTAQMRADEEESRLRAALENAAREWKLTFDAVESAILLIDTKGTIRRLNRPASVLLGMDFDAALGRNLLQLSPAEFWHDVKEVLEEAREWHQPSSGQIRDSRRNKSWQVNVSQFIDPALDKEQMIVTLRDVTATVELQESLRRSETLSAMGTLVAGVAHEVRNPLFSISATLDAFEARFGVQAEYKEYMRVLRQELNRMSGLIQELLDYGKPAVLDLQDTNVGLIVDRAVEACSILAGKYDIEIVKVLAADLPLVCMDTRRMAGVFRNVVENAVQHSSRGGKVTIQVRAVQEEYQTWVECRVQDSGTGFRPEDLPRLFEPFFTRRRGGTGLGLAIAERAIEQHGGKIIARNCPQGGAEMLIRLKAGRVR